MVSKTTPHTLPGKVCTQQGFSLMEMMIAMIVMTISLMGLAQLMTVAFQQNAFARYNTMAIEVVHKKVEQLRTRYSNELETATTDSNLTAGSHPSGSPGYETVTLTAPTNSAMADIQFQVSWAVAVSGNEKTVTVTVDPTLANDRISRTLTASTIFAP